MGFHRKYLFKCDWCGKEVYVEVDDKRSIDFHAYTHGYALLDIERMIEGGKVEHLEYYACNDCLTKITEGLNNGEA